MRARQILRLILLLQAVAALALAWALVRYQVLGSWWLAGAAALLCVVVVRMLITANNFLLTARYASATPDGFRIGPGARLALFAEEFMATLLQTSWFMARALAHEKIYSNSAHPPVLLLHGYGCNSGYWAQLMPRLDAQCISHATLDLEPVMGDIDDYVPLVARAVASLCEKTNTSSVIIVAHSMGGLVARAYMREHGSAHVARVITLGTPHHGTSLAAFGVGRNAAQMRRLKGASDAPESAWIRALAAAETPATRSLITSIFTHHDNIVAPQTSSVLPGARNIAFGGIGHVAMGRNRRILTRLMQEILDTGAR
jgi:pimeloyl-ACP methyl ester carboxylesterase